MRKKILSAIFAAALICLSALCLFGCGGDSDSGERKASLTYGKKYIDVSWINDTRTAYYIFNRDGTALYKFYNFSESVYDSYMSSYEITFKYSFDGEYVDLFFDSVEYMPEHNSSQDVSTTRRATFVAQKNFLRSGDTGSVLFICEDYLKNIPNFGKKAA